MHCDYKDKAFKNETNKIDGKLSLKIIIIGEIHFPSITAFVLLFREILRDIYMDGMVVFGCFCFYLNFKELVVCQQLSSFPGLVCTWLTLGISAIPSSFGPKC